MKRRTFYKNGWGTREMGMKLKFKLLAFEKYLDEGSNFSGVNCRLVPNNRVFEALITNFIFSIRGETRAFNWQH